MNRTLTALLLSATIIGQIVHIHYANAIVDSYYKEDGDFFYIGNGHIEIGFRRNNGALWSIMHKKSGLDLRKEKASSWQLAWGLTMFTRNMEHIYTDSSCSSSFRHRLQAISNGTEARLTWRAIRFKDGRDCPVEVSVEVSVYNDSPFTAWRASVRNFGPMAVERLTLPLIAGIQDLGKDGNDDCLVIPDREGRLFHAPCVNLSNWGQCYPSCFLNMQFMAFYDNSCGFYFATYDSNGNVKEFSWWKPTERWATISIHHYSEICFGSDFTLPYNTIVGVFEGDWFSAADIYKEWARNQWWTRDAISEKRTPDWTKGLALSGILTAMAPWQARNKTLGEIVTLASSHCQYFDASILVKLVGWENKGAWSWGDYFPPYEGWVSFDRMVRDLHHMNCKLMVNVGMVSINTATDLWRSQEPLNFALRSESGRTFHPAWDPYFDQVLMCVGTSYWQKQLEEVVLTIVRHGVDLIQFDCFPPVPTTFACYDASHGHPLGAGGSWLTATWLRTVGTIISKARQINPDVAFTAEGVSEIHIPYLDVAQYWRDTYAELGHQQKGEKKLWAGEAEIIPLFNYAYHEHILGMGQYGLGFYSRHAEYNILCLSRMLTWGEIPQINAQQDPETLGQWADRASFQMARKVVEARRTYAKDFLRYGQMLPLRMNGVAYTTVPFHPGSPYELSFELGMPALLGSAWKASDGSCGHILTNIGDKKITCQIDLDAYVRLFGEKPCTSYCVVDSNLHAISVYSNMPKSMQVSIDPRQIVLLVLTGAEGARGKTVESIDKAASAMAKARDEGRTSGLSEAETLLRDAIRFFMEGDYVRSRESADKAESVANTARRTPVESSKETLPSGAMSPWEIAFVATASAAGIIAYFFTKRRERLVKSRPLSHLFPYRPGGLLS